MHAKCLIIISQVKLDSKSYLDLILSPSPHGIDHIFI